VPAECCLQEAGWNPYYALLLGRLAAASTSHAVTLQYCLWDHFKARRCRLQIVIASLPSDSMRQRPLNMRPRLTPDARRACLPAVQVVSAGCGACDACTCACKLCSRVTGGGGGRAAAHGAPGAPHRVAHIRPRAAAVRAEGADPSSQAAALIPGCSVPSSCCGDRGRLAHRLHCVQCAGQCCISEPCRATCFCSQIPMPISRTRATTRIMQVVRFEGAMVPREQLFWNLTLQHLLLGCADATAVAAVFERLATNAVRFSGTEALCGVESRCRAQGKPSAPFSAGQERLHNGQLTADYMS